MGMIEPLPTVAEFAGRTHPILIGARWRAAQGGDPIAVIDPARAARLGAIGEASTQDVDDAVAAARAAFEEGPWPAMKPAARARLMQQIADRMEAHAEELAQLETLDNGKPVIFARGDIAAAIGAMRYFAGWADKIHGSTHRISMPGDYHVYTVKEPVGVAALIVPWNYPLVMAAMKLGPCLAAGCTAVLKPAEDTSLTALRLGELMLEAGLPEGVVNIVTGRGETVGTALVNHPGVDKIAFTGSTATGRIIARAAAERLVKVSLELGGKSPSIILPDADLAQAIPGSAMGIFYNSGQTCTAPSRLYVHEAVADDVIAGIAEVGASLTIGHGLDETSQLGPLVSERQFSRVSDYIAGSLDEGASIAAGGEQHGEDGYFLKPTIIRTDRHDITVMREEIFGPVLVVHTFREEAEAIRMANDTTYGLSGVVWTQNLGAGHRIAGRLKAGIIGINLAAGADWDVPLGGYKQSGIGRENGREGLENYLQTKSVFAAI